MDEDGYIHLTGRIKDMLIRGGENIYPTEVENFLHTHPDVADVQVRCSDQKNICEYFSFNDTKVVNINP